MRGEGIEATLDAALRIDYPRFEVVVVDDGSTDGTVARVMPYVKRGEVRLVRKELNEGKAMALNDALPCLNGEIVLAVDADAEVDAGILRALVPHFSSARVAAVTGNPRVSNRRSLLSKIQLIESLPSWGSARAQRVWGRIQTVSGVVVAFRKKSARDVGLFDPSMATEDIEMSWRLQKRFWDIRYEPKAWPGCRCRRRCLACGDSGAAGLGAGAGASLPRRDPLPLQEPAVWPVPMKRSCRSAGPRAL